MKKLEGIERELNTFQYTLERLAKLSRDLVNRSHFDSENILRKQVRQEIQIFYYTLFIFLNCICVICIILKINYIY